MKCSYEVLLDFYLPFSHLQLDEYQVPDLFSSSPWSGLFSHFEMGYALVETVNIHRNLKLPEVMLEETVTFSGKFSTFY